MSRRSVRIYGGIEPDTDDQIAAVSNSNLHVTMGDSPSIDAFDRVRVSNPLTILDSILKYGKDDDAWLEELTGTATSVHQFDQASALLTVTASGDKVVRQTREYYRYQPGKSQLVMMTFNMHAGGPIVNVRRRSGYFDVDNGVFLEQTAAGMGIVLRTNTSGSPVDQRIEQADWNLDPYPDFDPATTQILAIDLQWLGVGRVRVGFVIDGLIVYVHQFLHANIETTVYMTTAQLPCHHEIEATGLPATPGTMRVICTAIMSEGGRELFDGIPHGITSGAPAAVSGTNIPILSIRPKALFQGEINRVQIIQRALQVMNTGNGTAEVSVIFDAALTGASWASVESDSTMEMDTSATAITGGHFIAKFYVPATVQGAASVGLEILGKLRLSLDIAGANPTNLTIAITNHGTVVAGAALTWQEYQ